MKKLSLKEIIDATSGKLLTEYKDLEIEEISIDSRENLKNKLFVPIIGERFDGHIFLENAYQNGARIFLIDEKHKFAKEDIVVIEVDDTTKAYDRIAKYYREKYDILCVGVTGSVGKTSTKDMIYSVLKEKYKTLKNEGNLNNEIGIPKTIFNLDESYEASVLEMGLSFKGDILSYSKMVQPHIAVISNIGMSHIENFNNQKEIFEAKMEIAEDLKEHDILIVNGDDEFLKTVKIRKTTYKTLTYGFSNECDIYCTEYKVIDETIKFKANYQNNLYEFMIPTNAKHNIYNAMAAILVGLSSNMTIEEIKKGLSNFVLSKGRLTIIKKDNYRIIDDCYNASCDSMISALQVLKEYPNPRIAILGDILETGKYHEELHRKVGKNISNDLAYLITVGEDAKYIEEEAIKNGLNKDVCFNFKNVDELLEQEMFYVLENSTILIKASHAMELDKVVDKLNE